MAGKKRSAEEAEIVKRDDGGAKRKERAGSARVTKKGPKVVSAPLFKARAHPLHVTVTHTAPIVGEENGPETTADPGFLGALALQPSTFTTGSYGWKGSKRLTIELVDPDGEENEKVQVMLTVNATVIGSKQAAKEVEQEEVGAEDDAAGSVVINAVEDDAPNPQSTD